MHLHAGKKMQHVFYVLTVENDTGSQKSVVFGQKGAIYPGSIDQGFDVTDMYTTSYGT